MTKDRPRNRPGKGPKSGGFRGRGPEDGKPGGGKPWRSGADRPRPEREDASGDDKPWRRDRRTGERQRDDGERSGARGDAHQGGKPHASKYQGDKHQGDRPRRFDRPREDRVEPAEAGAPRKEFRGKADRFRDRGPRHGGPRHGGKQGERGQWERREAAFEENGEVWIWGAHAAGAALANPRRTISKAYVSRNAAVRAGLDPDALPKFAELMEPREIDMKLPQGAVHQGIAVRCAQIDGPDIADAAMRPEKTLVILDQVTDPQNVGAVFRSAAAFGLAGVVMQTRNAPLLGGALAKAAAGAIEQVDDIRAVNLSRAIDTLTDAGWRVIGLDGTAEQTLDEAFAGPEPLAIVLGAEGAGIRPGVAKACTGLARIPIGEGMESLNVSNAAAIAFYEAQRRHGAALPPAKPAVSLVPEADVDEAADDDVARDADWDETD